MNKYEHKFWARVNKDGPLHPVLCTQCWMWTGNRLKRGYGKLTCIGLAHRYSWTLHNGPILADAHVLHKCDNPSCVNPSHLFVGSPQDNTNDMKDKNRMPVGEDAYHAKLTQDQVNEIRRRYKRYSHTDGSGALAREFNVSVVEVWRIAKGLRWRA